MPQEHPRPTERPPLEVLTAGDRPRAELIALPVVGDHGRRRVAPPPVDPIVPVGPEAA
ncbi:hypothetical protein [Patulibacter defluvii]|uniref:hypothetical protein n=1 Tax=Patulibacter defluvii TaxID=3095358 RepID=UPI002A75433C|nr:hypothetical protein [Patulibacter sp. DM4]